MKVDIVSSEHNAVALMTFQLEECAKHAIKKNGVFRIGISGGSTLTQFITAIQIISTDFSRWRIFFCDERYVPTTDADSTYGCAMKALSEIENCKLTDAQFFPINMQLPLDECAKEYEERILKEFSLKVELPEASGTLSDDDDGCDSLEESLDWLNELCEDGLDEGLETLRLKFKNKKEHDIADNDPIPRFDLLLLGIGPDGHTCSLFPDHKLLEENKNLIAKIDDSPKPPSCRITMTLPLINRAKCCIFTICGKGKSDIAKRVFADKEQLPAGLVSPKKGELMCILDEDAAQYFERD